MTLHVTLVVCERELARHTGLCVTCESLHPDLHVNVKTFLEKVNE